MEDGKSSAIAQSADESAMKAVSQVAGNSSQSPQEQQQQQSAGVTVMSSSAQQQLTVAHRHQAAMAQQQHAAALSGTQTGGWPVTSVWDHATRNIAESMEGGDGASEYPGGRSVEWGDVKGSPPAGTCEWDWPPVSPMYPGRRGDVHSAGSFASGGGSGESLTVTGSPNSNHRGGLLLKNDGDLHDNNPVPDSRMANFGTGVEQQQQVRVPPSQVGGGGGPVALNTEQQRRLALGLGEAGGSGDRRKSNVQDYGNAGRVNGGGGDSLIGLKLGRRTYFEDSGAARATTSPTVFAGCAPGKKQRVQSPGVQVPRCQIEGCKQDLTDSKDYHRRHKVCEFHSKTPKVTVQGFDQRFCQQCSRFHMLSEFDEGKKSCRRRLAGHNERRRKPPPESAAIVSTGSSSVYQNEGGSSSGNRDDGKRGSNSLPEQACYIPMQRTPGSSSTSVDSDEQSGSFGTNFKLSHQSKGPWPMLGRGDDGTGGALACHSPVPVGERQSYLPPSADRVLMFLTSPKGAMTGAGVHHYPEAPGSMGPGLSLSSSTGSASVLPSLDAPNSPNVSGLTDSGRALSLLSSHHTWGSRGGVSGSSVALAVSTQSDVTLEHFLSDSNARTSFSPRGPPTPAHFLAPAPGTAEKLFRHHSRDLGGVGGLGEGREQQQQHRSLLSGLGMVGSYESRSTMLAVMQGQSEFRGMQVPPNSTQRPTIDLMQLPSPPSSHGQFAEFTNLRPLDSTLFDSQQML